MRRIIRRIGIAREQRDRGRLDSPTPIVGVAATSPEGGRNLFVIAREQSDRGNPHEKVRILFQRFSVLTLDFGEKSEYNNVL